MTAPDYRMDAVVGVAKHMRDVAHDQIAQAENRVVPLAQQVVDMTRERDALVELLAEAQEEMRLIRLKDSNAVYDPTLRIRIDAAIAAARGNEVEHG